MVTARSSIGRIRTARLLRPGNHWATVPTILVVATPDTEMSRLTPLKFRLIRIVKA